VQSDFSGLIEWTNRQVTVTRVYRHNLWASAFVTHFLYCLTVLVGLYLALTLTIASRPAFQVMSLLVLCFLLACIRGAVRVIGATEALPPFRSQVMAQSWMCILLPVVVPFLYLWNFLSSFGRRVRWRGIEYELISTEQTRVLTP